MERGSTAMRYSRNCVILAALCLLSLGLVMIYSTSAVRAEMRLGDAGGVMRRQFVWAALGLVGAVLVMDRDLEWLSKRARWVYLAACLGLVAVLIPGIGAKLNGARRWLRVPGGLTLQVSDVLKPALVLVLADLAVRRGARMRSFLGGTLPGLALAGIPALLIVVEPDLGTAAFTLAVGMAILFVSGVPTRHVMVAAVAMAGLAAFAYWQFPHVQARLAVYLNPEEQSLPGTFQVRQSLIALGSGGLLGKGLGEGVLKLFYVPEASSDFIFAILGEELGLVGALAVLGLFGVIIHHGFKIALGAADRRGFLVALGVVFLVGLQAIINMGVVTGSLPNKGIPLPFMSAGGSSCLFLLVSMGLLVAVANQSLRASAPVVRPAPAPRPEPPPPTSDRSTLSSQLEALHA